MATVLVTGGTGLVGNALSKALLEKGYEVIILTRDKKKIHQHLSKPGATKEDTVPPLKYALWNISNRMIDLEALTSADYIIHLAGAGVADKRWTKKRKQEILNSRVEGSDLIAGLLAAIPNKVKAVISASGIGWYGPDPSLPNAQPFVETAPPANDFLGETCRHWEKSLEPVARLGKRIVYIRTGIVVGRRGGALREFLKPLRFGIAPILGRGNQVISWIHVDDLVNCYITAIEKDSMTGAYNAVAPHPVTNREFTLRLARSRKKFFVPVQIPSFLLRLVLGEMSIEVLKSATVSCEKIRSTGFIFQFPELDMALKEILNQ